ncbi:hypothetical protein [Sneathiella glossodoripedis]|uniref:hypothetical protein n=1 Tax=Sneathiella glossodoripedis TaxID=418853 RepID=UPI000472A00F|nr:hypothetical protein [Sneathiella glossodoripedis]
MRSLSCVPFTAALLTTTVLSTAAMAQSSKQTLDTVTVYATRSEQSTFDVPAMVNTIELTPQVTHLQMTPMAC